MCFQDIKIWYGQWEYVEKGSNIFFIYIYGIQSMKLFINLTLEFSTFVQYCRAIMFCCEVMGKNVCENSVTCWLTTSRPPTTSENEKFEILPSSKWLYSYIILYKSYYGAASKKTIFVCNTAVEHESYSRADVTKLYISNFYNNIVYL